MQQDDCTVFISLLELDYSHQRIPQYSRVTVYPLALLRNPIMSDSLIMTCRRTHQRLRYTPVTSPMTKIVALGVAHW
jgi:hypothetical protein